jgi:hypothetical protein
MHNRYIPVYYSLLAQASESTGGHTFKDFSNFSRKIFSKNGPCLQSHVVSLVCMQRGSRIIWPWPGPVALLSGLQRGSSLDNPVL